MLEQSQQVGRVRLLADVHLDARPRLPEPAQQGGEDAGADALVDPDAQRAGRALREGGHVGLCRVELGDDRVGVAEQEPPRVGEVDPPRASGALDELLPDHALELGDLLAHGRLRVAELASRAAERAVPRHGVERHEVAQLDAGPSITFHTQYES